MHLRGLQIITANGIPYMHLMPLDVASVERILVYLSVAKTNRQSVRAVQHQTARRYKFRRKALWWLCAKLVLIISWSHLSGGKIEKRAPSEIYDEYNSQSRHICLHLPLVGCV